MLYPLASTHIKATRLHRKENKSENLYFSMKTAGMKIALKNGPTGSVPPPPKGRIAWWLKFIDRVCSIELDLQFTVTVIKICFLSHLGGWMVHNLCLCTISTVA